MEQQFNERIPYVLMCNGTPSGIFSYITLAQEAQRRLSDDFGLTAEILPLPHLDSTDYDIDNAFNFVMYRLIAAKDLQLQPVWAGLVGNGVVEMWEQAVACGCSDKFAIDVIEVYILDSVYAPPDADIPHVELSPLIMQLLPHINDTNREIAVKLIELLFSLRVSAEEHLKEYERIHLSTGTPDLPAEYEALRRAVHAVRHDLTKFDFFDFQQGLRYTQLKKQLDCAASAEEYMLIATQLIGMAGHELPLPYFAYEMMLCDRL